MSMHFDEKDSDEVIIEGEEDGVFDDIDETEGDASLRIKKLKEELKKCQVERKEYLDGWQRMKADYLNSQKRYEEERKLTSARAEMNLLEKILPLCDSFDMALTQGKEGGDTSSWMTGFAQIHAQLRGILTSCNVVSIEAEGAPFDPYIHEALSSTPVDSPDKHDTVVSVLQKGYMRGDTLLRPAKVIIGVFTE